MEATVGHPRLAAAARGARSSGTTVSWSEFHLRCLLDLRTGFAQIEEGVLLEAERAGEQHGREVLDAGVEFLHRIVEEAPRGRELVFDVAEFGLELLEVL